MNIDLITEPEVIKYYNECWLERFENGHNPVSLAMHLGIFSENNIDNDLAKRKSNEFLATHIGIPGSREFYLADFGCGVGGTCLYFAETYPMAKIKGINISAQQLDFANRVKKEKNINGQIEYFTTDYSDTKLESEKFDFVVGVESICHSTDKLSAYKEAYRILKPEGVFALMDYFEEKDPETAYEKELLHVFRKGWAVTEYIKDYETHFAQAGYKHISVVSVLEKVNQGIIHSYNKAIDKINSDEFNSLPQTVRLHLKACVALKELVEKKVIDYKIVTAQK